MVKPSALLLGIIAGFFIFLACQNAEAQWSFAGNGIKEAYANIISCDIKNDNVTYIATDNFLYVSEDEGRNWKQIFSSRGMENKINFIGASAGNVFCAAADGFYFSADAGISWQKSYQKPVYCIALDTKNNGILYIGTDEGIFVSKDNAFTWQFCSVGLGIVKIKYIIIGQSGKIYACSENRIFKAEDQGANWKEIYSLLRNDAPETQPGEYPAEEAEESFVVINSLAVNSSNPVELYAATSKGVFFLGNEEKTWAYMTKAGLDRNQAQHILFIGDKIYIASYRGVFLYDRKDARWQQLWEGMSFLDARFLAAGNKNSIIWAATAKGIYKQPVVNKIFYNTGLELPQEIVDKFKNEPTIAEAQRAAIRYAEVHPDKIKNWRSQAAKKAWLPEVSVGVDRDVSDYWHWETGSTGAGNRLDDDLRKGKDIISWDATMKWDFGNLVFNDDQTNIDVRSRLMVELRDDIMNDITRLYYERRRLQVELLTSEPKSEKERFDKLLRLEELTANIDSLTGGYFSTRLKRNKAEA